MVTTERWLELTTAVLGRGGESRDAESWCAACGDVLGVAGAGLALMGGDSSGPLGWSDPAAQVLEDLQYTLGQGPCIDAFHTGDAVGEADVQAHMERWPAFTPPLVQAGMGAVFAFPLALGGARLGALTLYKQPPGPLAQITSLAILEMQAGAPADRLADALAETGSFRAEIHQATGMVSVQLGVRADEAFVRLRARAYAEGRPLADVAAEVVARRLRFNQP
jgi:hypothetical protein